MTCIPVSVNGSRSRSLSVERQRRGQPARSTRGLRARGRAAGQGDRRHARRLRPRCVPRDGPPAGRPRRGRARSRSRHRKRSSISVRCVSRDVRRRVLDRLDATPGSSSAPTARWLPAVRPAATRCSARRVPPRPTSCGRRGSADASESRLRRLWPRPCSGVATRPGAPPRSSCSSSQRRVGSAGASRRTCAGSTARTGSNGFRTPGTSARSVAPRPRRRCPPGGSARDERSDQRRRSSRASREARPKPPLKLARSSTRRQKDMSGKST